jgi:predicted N-acetyltransferase YhbS
MLELLERRHDRQGFDCGEPALNRFLTQTARQSIAKGSSRTFVWTDPSGGRPNQILGFFTLATDVVVTTELAPPLARRYPGGRIPVVKLARLAVDKDQRGARLGRMLVWEAMKKAIQVHEATGIAAFWVDAKNDGVAGFYRHLGFLPAEGKPLSLYMAIKTLAAGYQRLLRVDNRDSGWT